MALYQPSNITPSTFAGIGGGVVDASDNVSISWQVNGTDAMVQFIINIYENNAASTPLPSHTVTMQTIGEPPFYGTDANGNPVFYVYEPGVTWSSWGLSNGNSYKMKITQGWFDESTDPVTLKYVVQNSESVFITRAAPTLSISPVSGTLTSVAQTFTASFAQTNGDSVSWVRWVLRDAEGNVLDDTGTIYTGVLSYTYNGLFTGNTYMLSCTVETSSGAAKTVTNTYAVSYSEPEQTGGLTLSCNPDDSVSLSWMAGADIPGTPSAEDYGSVLDGVLHLAAERSITWNEVNGESMAFSAPYCFAWRGKVSEATTESETVNSGTWTVSKTTTQSNSTTKTGNTVNWTKNPSVTPTANTTTTVSVSATTAHNVSTSKTAMAAIQDYDALSGLYYGTATITSAKPITNVSEYSTYNITSWAQTMVGDFTCEITLYSDQPHAYGEAWVTLIVTTTTYSGTASKTVSQTGISNPVVISTTAISAAATVTGTSSMSVSVTAASSGSYSVTISYDYAASSNQMYYAQWYGTLGVSGGTLTSGSIVSSEGTGGATITVNKNLSGATEQNSFVVTIYNANDTDIVSTTVRLYYTTQLPNEYKSVVTGTKAGASSASITSTTATSASVSINSSGEYTVTMYDSSNTSKTATVLFSAPTVPDSPDLAVVTGTSHSLYIRTRRGNIGCYPETDSVAADNIVKGSISSSTGADNPTAVTRCHTINRIYFPAGVKVCMPDKEAWRFAVYYYTAATGGYQNMPHALTDADGEYTIPNSGWYRFVFAHTNNGTITDDDLVTVRGKVWFTYGEVDVPEGAWYALGIVRTNSFETAFFDDENKNLVSARSESMNAPLPDPVTSVSAYGEQECDYVYLSSNSSYSFALAGWTPGWDGNTLFYAAFGSDLQAGTTNDSSSLSIALYRAEGTELTPIGIFGGDVSFVRDYAIRSGREYSYVMYYVASGVYSAGAVSGTMCRQFRQHTLIEAEADAEDPYTYHPVHVWRFRDNLDAGAYTNQNTPVLLQNFTKYPLWQPSSQASRSGTLVALVGRFVNGVYSGDTADDMDALFALSESVNPLFYRDMKGNLYMVRLSGPVTQTIDNRTGPLEVSVSVPWVEVGDAKDVKIYTEG